MEEVDPSIASTTDTESSSDEIFTDTDDARSEISLGDDLYVRRLKLRNADQDSLFQLRRKRQRAMLRLRELSQGSAANRGEPHSLTLFVQDVDATNRRLCVAP